MSDAQDFFTASATLAETTELDLDAMQLLHRLEISGDAFYSALADRVDDTHVAELFRRNGREETGHARRIRRAIEIKAGADYEPPAEMSEAFAISLPDRISDGMLDAILQAELAGDSGYQGWADHEADPEIVRLLRLNGREETIHGERVREAMAVLRGGAAK